MKDIYQKIFDLTSESVVIHNKGVIINCSKPFFNLFGYNYTNEVVGKQFIDIHFPLNSKNKMGINNV